MNPLLIMARIYVPEFIKRKKVQELFRITADAFESDLPVITNLTHRECLETFAHFSKMKAEELIQFPESTDKVKQKLFQNACRLGEKLRKDFRIKTKQDVMRLSKILYQILKIDFNGNASGDVVINNCFFSSFYTPEVCRIISSLDEGLAAGLSAGGRLVFQDRITEGKDCCKAIIHMEEIRS
jgi:hypothetical protein